MQIYFFTAGVESNELSELERRLVNKLPYLQRLTRIDEVSRRVSEKSSSDKASPIFVIFPVLAAGLSLDRIVSIAEQPHPGVFLIFISKEISASDYKRLVRSGGADWVPLQGAPEEILDIIARANRSVVPAGSGRLRPPIVAFVPSGGGVGNATLAIETAVQIKTSKASRHRRICLLDLDVQSSHVCDYLDIEPRLQVKEIIENPERLDTQLFDLFISHHATTGIDVLAAPRSREGPVSATIPALDALFNMISERYDLVLLDLPPTWLEWTGQIMSVSDLAIVTGLNNVPALRHIAETLKAVRNVAQVPSTIVVALNRCTGRFTGGIARRQHVTQVLPKETVIYVREDVRSANHSLNTGVPISLASPSSRIAKDVRPLADLVSRQTSGTASPAEVGTLTAQHQRR